MTKYNNLQFKALINGSISTGTIRQDGETFISLTTMLSRHHMSYEKFFCLIESGNTTFLETVISDFEIVPRDPETYRDWQVGDKVMMKYVGWNEQIEVIFRSGELVVCKDSDNNATETKTCEQLYRERGRLVLTDIEKQIIEERKKAEWKPQDGDICYAELISDWVFIKKDGEFLTENYAALKLNDGYTNFDNPSRINNDAFVKMIRIATEGEKQKLFDAMAKVGKRWNAEKKVVVDIPKPYEFKKGEPVLVRNFVNEPWELSAFIEKDDKKFKAGFPFGAGPNHRFNICLPYNERTMHLLGTSNDYVEEC